MKKQNPKKKQAVPVKKEKVLTSKIKAKQSKSGDDVPLKLRYPVKTIKFYREFINDAIKNKRELSFFNRLLKVIDCGVPYETYENKVLFENAKLTSKIYPVLFEDITIPSKLRKPILIANTGKKGVVPTKVIIEKRKPFSAPKGGAKGSKKSFPNSTHNYILDAIKNNKRIAFYDKKTPKTTYYGTPVSLTFHEVLVVETDDMYENKWINLDNVILSYKDEKDNLGITNKDEPIIEPDSDYWNYAFHAMSENERIAFKTNRGCNNGIIRSMNTHYIFVTDCDDSSYNNRNISLKNLILPPTESQIKNPNIVPADFPTVKKPPLGIMPENFWIETRVRDLKEAINRYEKEKQSPFLVNIWKAELDRLYRQYTSLQQLNIVAVNKKTGDEYIVLHKVVDKTKNKDVEYIFYVNILKGKFCVREKSEFLKKFNANLNEINAIID